MSVIPSLLRVNADPVHFRSGSDNHQTLGCRLADHRELGEGPMPESAFVGSGQDSAAGNRPVILDVTQQRFNKAEPSAGPEFRYWVYCRRNFRSGAVIAKRSSGWTGDASPSFPKG